MEEEWKYEFYFTLSSQNKKQKITPVEMNLQPF